MAVPLPQSPGACRRTPVSRNQDERPTWSCPRRIALLLCAVLAVPGTACVRTVHLGTEEVAQDIRENASMRSAQNLPTSFTIVVPARTEGDCPVRLRDDALMTVLDLRRSIMLPAPDGQAGRAQSVGDYRATPQGRYGDTAPGDGIRVDCTQLRAMGIVTLGAPGG